MLVKPTNLKPAVRQSAEGVTITLTEFEAGFLRTVLLQYSKSKDEEGFAAKLFRQLNQYSFPTYEKVYTNWEKCKG